MTRPFRSQIAPLLDLDGTVNSLLDLQSLYNMGFDLHPRPNIAGDSGSIAFTPDETSQLRAAEAFQKLTETAAKELAEKLQEDNIELLRRAVCFAGQRFCQTIYERTMEIEASGGLYTKSGERRRTPGGVFFKTLKEELAPDCAQMIFEEVQPDEQSGSLQRGAILIGQSGDDLPTPTGSSLNAHSVEFTPSSLEAAPLSSSALDANSEPFVPSSSLPDSNPE